MIRFLTYLLPLLCLCSIGKQHRDAPLRARLCPEASSAQMMVYQLAQNGQFTGYAIQLGPATSAAYYSNYNGEDQEENFKPPWLQRDVKLLTSAGFTTNGYQRPLGLSVTNGQVDNRRLSRAMDGLVVLQNGQLSVFNIKNEFNIDLGSNFNKKQNTASILAWASVEKASLFQLQLLAFGNKKLISEEAPKKLAIRKLLARTNTAEGTAQTWLFYLNQGTDLFSATQQVFSYLQAHSDHIEFMVNLDTGVHDALQIAGPVNTCFGQEIHGFSRPIQSRNLLIFN